MRSREGLLGSQGMEGRRYGRSTEQSSLSLDWQTGSDVIFFFLYKYIWRVNIREGKKAI